MTKFILIFLASGVGGLCRYALEGCSTRLCKSWLTFPVGTLVVNVAGCFAIGVLAMYFTSRDRMHVSEEYRIALMVGLIGGFTTFSAFGLEAFRLLGENQAARAGLNVGLSVALAIAAVWLGHRMAAQWFGV
jgi:fluoride exporter